MADPSQLHGRKLGDRRVRVDRPHARYFRYPGPGVLEAKLAAEAPTTVAGRGRQLVRHSLFGRPLASDAELAERLPKWKALPVFSSDVMSSVAYASEASTVHARAAGAAAYGYLMPISLLIVALLFIVTFSYRQTIRAYPNGGGSYIVARANLGVLPGLVAAGSLLTDYVLTVAVSVSAGVYNLDSALPILQGVEVPLIVVCILLVTAGQPARPARERHALRQPRRTSSSASMLLMIGLGVVRTALGDAPVAPGRAALPRRRWRPWACSCWPARSPTAARP